MRISVGGRKKRLTTGFGAPVLNDAAAFCAICHIEKKGTGRFGSPIGRTRLRTPNVSVTTSESTRVTDPTGNVSGTMNQSLPYVLAYSIIIRCARSVGPTGTSPYAMRASSISQNRGAGAPAKLTGAGIVASTIEEKL